MLKIDARHIAVAAALVCLVAAASVSIRTSSAASRTAVLAAAGTLLEEGDALTAGARFEAAREVYGQAAELARSAGVMPVEAVRRVANAYYFEGRYAEAAEVLEQFAAEAALWHDPVAQAWALADAAVLAGLADAEEDSAWHWKRLRTLLESSAFPAAARAEMVSKLESRLNVFAPHLSTW